ALGVGNAAIGRVRTAVVARLQAAVDEVVGVRHLVIQHHHRRRERVHVERGVVADVGVHAGTGAAAGDLHVGPGATVAGRHRIAVVLVGQLPDGDGIAAGVRGGVEFGQHALPVGRGAHEPDLRLHPLHERFRAFDADAAAHVRVDLDVDHGRARAGGRVHQVDALGIHGGGAAGVRDAVAAGAGVDRTGAAGGVQHVVAAAAGHHVAAAAARSEEHTSELQSRENLVCRLLL